MRIKHVAAGAQGVWFIGWACNLPSKMLYLEPGKETVPMCKVASPMRSKDNAVGLSELYESDPRYQPITEEQLQKELMAAQQAYKEGQRMDALEFCAQMERRHLSSSRPE